MKILKGKRALVTGAASGIGRELALRLADQGMHLLLADRDEPGMAETARIAADAGVSIATQQYDASITESVSALARAAEHLPGGVDLLVNNAGIAYYGPTDRMSLEHFDRVISINMLSHIRLTQELLPMLLSRPDTHILNVCSIMGLVGLPKVCAYNAAKFGLVGYTESLRSEYGPQGLGVTALCPGLVRTNLFDTALSKTVQDHKNPPRWTTTTAEQVAKAAIKGIRRNRRVVVVEPIAKTLCVLKRFAPGLVDFALHIGRKRKEAKRLAYWAARQTPPPISNDEETREAA
ncbi:SDR family NAD(P)-dependent oxidoreductase [Aeoliella mucimassa]|uniref:Oxidoreductase SadH n=1 Tax=Aeoliella mucimassa TaxID=2527972 RepID=A0A518ANU3_9BACT|nr:SDR family oxidoreductase [Aeoliella mucimassa]QDU56388.1 Putative oxidoreductase SadH [Aeoliella mucimassa]